ncbi:unnamed protein product [Rotaria socialis]|uniref:Uncharacterized protein n=1 Tax=Rotaria socialis TaxID=392032 RepID=A0A818APN4_9BILA|nr:unnamed protein product [Rotaria socialis]CAF3409954.1 unnamed protein product [Rotaria socialis]CAF3575523.1 unnamed protein product [Rotaria socialis]CAF4560634.1 unnamed protein product [Rotaria socialis]CAF4657829.1 unnamed protein product [Rotaria socialis]
MWTEFASTAVAWADCLRLCNDRGRRPISFEVRLSFEYKINNYLSVFIKKETETNDHGYLSTIPCTDQPIMWIHSSLVETNGDNSYDISRIFDHKHKIRLI